MVADLYISRHFNDVSFEAEYDERTGGEWVKEIGLGSETGHYQKIEFMEPWSLDMLIYTLVTIKTEATARMSGHMGATIDTVRTVDHTDTVGHRFEDGLHHCPWCDTPIPEDSWYRHKLGDAQFCRSCGVLLTDFKD